MPTPIPTVRTVHDLRARIAEWRKAGETVALVPTMGALHAGHLSLIDVAKRHAARVVVSIFVNPIQFGPREDLARYPRDEAADRDKLAATAAHLLYAPSREEMYPPGFATKVSLPSLTQDLCGAARPNHFEGVATVVTKLLLQAAPDVAVFGEKDYQQLLIIKQLVRDLNIEVEIVPGPIVREADGLALSSRNAYLSPSERKTAPILFKTLSEVAAESRPRRRLRQRGRGRALQARGGGLSRGLCGDPRPRHARAASRPPQRSGARARRRLSHQDAADRQCGRVRSRNRPQPSMRRSSRSAARMVAGMSVIAVRDRAPIGRRVGGGQIAPALKGAPRLRARGDELRIEHDRATWAAVVLQRPARGRARAGARARSP